MSVPHMGASFPILLCCGKCQHGKTIRLFDLDCDDNVPLPPSC